MNGLIHGAVRRDLQRFTDAVDAFPESDRQRADQLRTAWDFFYGELDYHHHSEHAIAWPALRRVGVDGALLTQMDAEHERLAAALAAAGEKLRALQQTPTKATADQARTAIATLRSVAEEHMAHEERDVEPLYLAKRNMPELKAMSRKFARDRSPLRAGDFFAWLENGASAEQRAGLRRELPPAVLAVFSRVLGRRYRKQVAPVWA